MVTDPIADMLTRIRNGQRARHEAVEMPASKMKLELAKILKSEGYIRNFKIVQDEKQGLLKLFLKYDDERKPAIGELRRASKPGRRMYAMVDEIPRVKNGLGIAIVSTSRGIMTDRRARAEHVGGEVICTVW